MIDCAYQAGDAMWDAICEQVGRMEQLDGFPRGTAAKRELSYALLVADSLEEATELVSDIVRHETRCPVPADIRRTLYERHEAAEAQLPDVPDAAAHLGGAFKRGRNPELDQHLDLIVARMAEISRAHGRIEETDLSRKLAEFTERLREAK